MERCNFWKKVFLLIDLSVGIKSCVLPSKFTKTSPYRKTTFIFLFFSDFYAFYIFINNFMICIKINDFKIKSGPYGPIWAHMGPNPENCIFCFLNFSRSSRARAGPIWAYMGPYGPEKSQKINEKITFTGAFKVPCNLP